MKIVNITEALSSWNVKYTKAPDFQTAVQMLTDTHHTNQYTIVIADAQYLHKDIHSLPESLRSNSEQNIYLLSSYPPTKRYAAIQAINTGI